LGCIQYIDRSPCLADESLKLKKRSTESGEKMRRENGGEKRRAEPGVGLLPNA